MCFPTLRCNSGDRRDFPFSHIKMWLWCLECLAVPQGQHSVFWYLFSYTTMQLWWWEGLSLCSHQAETLMLGMFTKMQLWWWGIFLFAHMKMRCKEWLAVPYGQLSVIWYFVLLGVHFCLPFFLHYDATLVMEGISLFAHIKMWLWCCEGCAVPVG